MIILINANYSQKLSDQEMSLTFFFEEGMAQGYKKTLNASFTKAQTIWKKYYGAFLTW